MEETSTDLAIYNGSDIVVQHNKLIDAPRYFSLQEQKFFLLLLSKIDPNNNDQNLSFRVDAKNFATLLGLEYTNNVYRDLKSITKRFLSRVLEIQEDDTILQTHVVRSIYYRTSKGYLDVKISDEIIPYLIGLKSNFTQYKISQAIKLSSRHAIRIYELLKKQETIGERTLFLDDLKKKLGISSNQYKRYSDLQKDVLEISKREINSKTDLVIDYQTLKDNKKIIGIKFIITSKKYMEDFINQSEKEDVTTHKLHIQQIQSIIDYGFSEKTALSMTKNLTAKEIQDALNAVMKQIKKGNVKNIKAMLRTSFKERWNTSTYVRVKTKRCDQNNKKISNKNCDLDTQKTSQKLFGFLSKILNKKAS